MAGRKAVAGNRSGQFSTAANNQPIVVNGAVAAVYRIFNSGESQFGVSRKVGATQKSVAKVKKQSSIDVELPAGQQLLIEDAGAEGVFELLGHGRSTRSGHFRAANPSANPPKLASVQQGSLYRVYNAGRLKPTATAADLQFVLRADTTDIGPVEVDSSLDVFAIGGATPVEITVSRADSKPISGAYDLLDGSLEVRRGRFSFPAVDVQNDRLIADLSSSTTSRQYRITNTSLSAFEIKKTTPSTGNTTSLGSLASGQSIDFTVLADKIFVLGVNKESYSGVYDYLGALA